MILNTNTTEMKPMKIMDLRTDSAHKAYVTRSPEDTHTKEEMDAVLRAINYTKLFKQKESYSKMDEEEQLVRPIPLR
jgi:hypothetical protein